MSVSVADSRKKNVIVGIPPNRNNSPGYLKEKCEKLTQAYEFGGQECKKVVVSDLNKSKCT